MVFKCYFTTFDFSLELNVFNKDRNILLTKGTVLQTGPDELFYDKEFCKLEIRENMLIIKDFLDRDNYMFNIAELARGIYNIKHLQKPSQINHVDLIKRIK